MLRRFIYLDSGALSQYVTALEGGALTGSTRRSTKTGSGKGGMDGRVIHATGERKREEEESHSTADTDEARFDRLLRAANADPDTLAWIDVLDPETDFKDIGIGAMVAWECEIHVPDVVRALGRSSETIEAINMMQRILPAARRLGLDTEGLPDAGEMDAVAKVVGSIDAKTVVVGEDDDTDWHVAGRLDHDFIHGDLDGHAQLIGKVTKVLRPGQWQPYLSLPGMNLLSREERRKRERQRPEASAEGEYLAGPALMLDILAIYR